mgnify:CR=1 FL=1
MKAAGFTIRRFESNPIIRPEMDARMGRNINGPSLIRVPDWLPAPLGRYYLYFADHKGTYIRLAYSDHLGGPWKTHLAGSLDIADSHFPTRAEDCNITYVNSYGVFGDDVPHIASPDVHVDEEQRRIRMYFHGMLPDGNQVTRVALSDDGIRFQALPENLGNSYFRVFRHEGWHYALVMRIGGGLLLGGSIGNLIDRIGRDGVTDFIAIGPWPPFNVADMAVTIGALLLVLAILFSAGDG